MQVGLSTACFFMREFNEDAVKLIEQLGVKKAEVFLSTFCEYSPTFAQNLIQNKGDLQIDSVHVLNTQFEPQLFTKHVRAKNDAFYYLQQVLQTANILRSKYYCFHGIARLKSNSTPKDHGELAPYFDDIIQMCQKHNVTLCLENVHWAIYNKPKIFKQIHAKCPHLKGVLDVKHARISGFSYIDYIEDMRENIAFAHISDINSDGKMCLPGQGNFPFEELIKRLLGYGFNGNLIIEVYTNDYKNYQEIVQSCAYLQELIYKLT